MADWYINPIGGNDSDTGTSFAHAWQTINAAAASGIQPGDRVKYIQSPSPTDMGQTAQWTNTNALVQLSSAVTQMITDCSSAWTGLNGTTSTVNTNGQFYREGNSSVALNIPANAPTGIAAYYKLPATLNLSAYQQLSYFMYNSAGVALPINSFSINLCSDASGQTPVNTFTYNSDQSFGNGWGGPQTADNGSPLGSNINSISFVIKSSLGNTNPGTIYLDQIQACKAPSAADSLSLNSLIGKNQTGEGWYALRSINATALYLEIDPTVSASNTPKGYTGTTESKEIWKHEPYRHIVGGGTFITLTKSGSAGAPITISGGWDSASGVNQVWSTWFDLSVCQEAYFINTGNNSKYINIENMGVTRSQNGFSTYDFWQMKNCYATCCSQQHLRFITTGNTPIICTGDLYAVQGGSQPLQFQTFGKVILNNLYIYSSGSVNTINPAYFKVNGLFKSCNNTISNSAAIDLYCLADISSATANDNTGGPGISIRKGRTTIGTAACSGNSGYGLNVDSSSSFKVYNLSTSNNTQGSVYVGNCTAYGKGVIHNWTHNESTKLNFTEDGAFSDYIILSHNDSGVANSHYQRSDYATVITDTGSTHGSSTYSWKVSPTNAYRDQYYPVKLQIGEYNVAANTSVTVKAWVALSKSANVAAALVIPANQLQGIGSSDLVANMPAVDNTWQQLSLTFTPTEAGVFQVYLYTWSTVGNYGSTLSSIESAWVCDQSASQP